MKLSAGWGIALAVLLLGVLILQSQSAPPGPNPPPPVPPPVVGAGKTVLSISGNDLMINGQPTHKGSKIEGSVITLRAANGIFDTTTRREFFNDFDNTATGKVWQPNNIAAGMWNANANTDRLVAAMPSYKANGILMINVNMQGGCSCTRDGEDGMTLKGGSQTPDNNPYKKDSSTGQLYIDQAYLGRLEKIVRKADDLGMLVNIGVLYFGQDHRIPGDADRLKAVELLTTWVLDNGFSNVIIEAKNENQDSQALAMVQKAKATASARGKRIYATTSLGYKVLPSAAYLQTVDVISIHTNGYAATTASDGFSVSQIIDYVRTNPNYRGQPIVITEDGPFWAPANMDAATAKGVGHGYYNDKEKQSVPANWELFSSSDQAFAAKSRAATAVTP